MAWKKSLNEEQTLFLTSLKTFYFFASVGKQIIFFKKIPGPTPRNIKWSVHKSMPCRPMSNEYHNPIILYGKFRSINPYSLKEQPVTSVIVIFWISSL